MVLTDPLDTLARRFFHFDHWAGASPLGDGNINDTYRIDVQKNGSDCSFVLQRLNHAVFRQPEAVMENIRRVTAYLAGQTDFDLIAPAPLQTLDGHPCFLDGAGNYWRVFPFLKNTFAPERVASPEVAREAARAYGVFARELRNFPADSLVETIPGFHDTNRRWTVFEQTLKADPAQRVASAQAEIEGLWAAKKIFDHIHYLKTSGLLPMRVTHNDTKAGNVLLDSTTGRAVAVIDLDTVMPGTVLSDFGDMVRTFVPDRYEDDPDTENLCLRTDILDALTEGFLAETDGMLTRPEREHLLLGAQWIIGEQALRFLTDYLAGDVYYKTRYAEHNLVRARNQLAVLREVSRNVIPAK